MLIIIIRTIGPKYSECSYLLLSFSCPRSNCWCAEVHFSLSLQLSTENITPFSLSRSINDVPVKAAAGVRTPPLKKKNEHSVNQLKLLSLR